MSHTDGIQFRKFTVLDFKRTEDEDGPKGLVKARIATTDALDAYETVFTKNSFGEQKFRVYWQHDWWMPAFGRGDTHEDKNEVIADFAINLRMTFGNEAFESMRMSNELQEYSYAFDPTQWRVGKFESVDDVIFYEKIYLHEVSPVHRGAAVNTGTLDIRGYQQFAGQGTRVQPQELGSDLEQRIKRLERAAGSNPSLLFLPDNEGDPIPETNVTRAEIDRLRTAIGGV